MISLGNNCYCYNEDCNQKKWEELGYEGKRQYTVVSDFWCKAFKINGKTPRRPKCPYCKKAMTVTANMSDDWDY